jgi:hypothetical protein
MVEVVGTMVVIGDDLKNEKGKATITLHNFD